MYAHVEVRATAQGLVLIRSQKEHQQFGHIYMCIMEKR